MAFSQDKLTAERRASGICVKCGVSQVHEFDRCDACLALARARPRSSAPQTKKRGVSREYHLKNRYGITASEWDTLFVEQGRSCAVCKITVVPNNKRATGWCVDHDHTTGRVRGILCAPCNFLLGNLGDEPGRVLLRVREVFSYLKAHYLSRDVSDDVLCATAINPDA